MLDELEESFGGGGGVGIGHWSEGSYHAPARPLDGPDGRIRPVADEGDEREDGQDEAGGSSGLATAAQYSVIGFVFPIALLLGFYLGRLVGTWLGGPLVGEVAGVVLGSAAAFYNLYSMLKRIERREAERRSERETDRGKGG